MFIVRDKLTTFEEVAGHVAQSVIAIAVGMRKDIKPNIVGTGFALEWAEFFVTCWHVAQADEDLHNLSDQELSQRGYIDNKLRIALRKDETYVWREAEAKTWFRIAEKSHDVCVYRFIGVAVPPLQIWPDERASLGSDVGIVGFPLGNALQGDVMRPYIIRTNIAGAVDVPLGGGTSPRIALATAVAGGFSGGPVFAANNGQILGMVASKVMERDASGSEWPAGISLAINPGWLREISQAAIGETTRIIKEALRSHLK